MKPLPDRASGGQNPSGRDRRHDAGGGLPCRQAAVGGVAARFGVTRQRISPAPPDGAERIGPAGVGVVKVLLLSAGEVAERVEHAEFDGGGVAGA
jgi:hypothetical protein